jgi:cytochrome c-type biogenesis protein CcmH/NrfF
MRAGALAAVALTALAACAPSRAPEDIAARVSTKVMSPFCPGVTLHDCPSGRADELRLEIQRWAAAGMDEQAILARLEREYGPAVRAAPPAEGAGWLAWLLPGLALAGGGILAWRTLARWTSAPGAPTAGQIEATPAERRRLEAELERAREAR